MHDGHPFPRKDARNAAARWPHGHAPMTPPALPRGSEFVARTRVVSWLRAASPAFPTGRSVAMWARVLVQLHPLQWRGRTGVAPVSVAPLRSFHSIVSRSPQGCRDVLGLTGSE